ncbi:hypothetical protein DL96DRAFT_1682505 [Flagelloscypha sp. PMI_526]|nr:hypothetical protein DL96DRAFT_1682505 [Flagelloscypha sp. PMI_526]
MAPPSPPLPLPGEILEQIMMFAVDSGGYATTLRLCYLSRHTHESVIRRLYHTLHITDESKLTMILHTSIPLRPSIAEYVRVLNLQTCSNGQLMTEALTTFTSLLALRIPFCATLDPACMLSNLKRLMQMSSGNIPGHVAQNLTHLYIFGETPECISQILQRKDQFSRLTHLMVMDELSGTNSKISTQNALKLVSAYGPAGLPNALEVFIILLGEVSYGNLGHESDFLVTVQNTLELDDRIVAWVNQSPDQIPTDWVGPALFDFQCEGHLIEQSLGALPDGAIGIWEAAEQWIQKVRKK